MYELPRALIASSPTTGAMTGKRPTTRAAIQPRPNRRAQANENPQTNPAINAASRFVTKAQDDTGISATTPANRRGSTSRYPAKGSTRQLRKPAF